MFFHLIEGWRKGQIGDRANTVRYKMESIGDIYMGVHCTIISTFLYISKFFIIRCLEKNYRHSFKSLTDPLNCWYVKLPWL